MDSNVAAEEFPALYRTILDGVAELEQAGLRDEAHRVRRAATAAYSGAWGDSGHRRLQLLILRIDRGLASPDRARTERVGPLSPRPGLKARLALVHRVPTTR